MASALFAACLACAIALSAQGRAGDQRWAGPAALAGTYQRVRELSGREQVSAFLTTANPRDLSAVCEERKTAEEAARDFQQRHLRSLDEQAPAARDLTDVVWTRHDLAQLLAYDGRMPEAVEHLAAARAIVATPGGRRQFPGMAPVLEGLIGVAQLRRGELENCVMHPNASRCIFPITGAGRHEQTAPADAAFAAFMTALQALPDDLELRWLLNVTAMALNRYPDGVPARLLIPPARFESAENPGRFEDVAHHVGLDVAGRAGGAVMDDLDNDGRLDIAISSVDPCEPLHVFIQQTDGRFAERASGTASQLGGINLVQADYNNDGWLDLYVMRGGWEVPARNSLLKNNADGTFTDVTEPAGLLDVPHSTHSAAWADVDNDGWLDLFVGHERTPSRMFRNRGDGTFEDISRQAGLDFRAFVKGVAWGDYDRDGDPDLYVSNYGEPNALFRNEGDGAFVDVTRSMGVALPLMSFATWFFDYDNDGWPDLFVAGFVPSVAESVKPYVGQRSTAETMKLYHNAGGVRFDDVTEATGLDRVLPTMGANYGDIDNDGWLDIVLGTGAPSYAALVPNMLFRNHEGRRFVDVTAATGTGHLQKGHGVAIGDIDGDGDEDIFENIGGFSPADAYTKVLFRNPGHHRHWLGMSLVGKASNRAALGARVVVVARDAGGATRAIPRVVSSGGSFGSSPLMLHVGLGDATAVERVEVFWPVGGKTQVVTGVTLDRTIRIVEP